MDPAEVHGETTANFAAASLRGTLVPLSAPEDRISAFAATTDTQTINVYNARPLRPHLHVEKDGFELVTAESKVVDFHDEKAVTSVYYQECEEIIKAATGCCGTHVLQHLRRNGEPGQNFDGVYGLAVHADVSPVFEDTTTHELRAKIAGRHFAIYNLWRSTDMQGNVEMMPLAICDPNTVASDDMVPAEAKSGAGRQAVYYRLAHNVRQRFYFFPHMTPHEVMVFKQYDTRQDFPCLRSVFHTAFADPKSPSEPRRRESLEVRVVAIFGEQDPAAEKARKARFLAEIPVRTPMTAYEARKSKL
eukprot:gnl/TRDRNA2_/TRDRNA2_49631_c0_seq1.p1 gnl/TRDRNA2_/TRDRNA2_49631_c0~~gnl/TRDRNA2_/TRDRNA2_49631_c0_seq1.p1  ORF type:complete len:322 (-),score=60.35 gnl/TRDRNA2_/TRDRNA2_49631_c0_seq1:124-1035(-)